jgi:hypothetical protein
MNSPNVNAPVHDPLALELGKSLIICQLFEGSLLMLLSLISEHKAPSEGTAFELVWDFGSKKPLGQLFDLLKKDMDLPQDFEAYLQKGIDLRNELVHRFIRENIRLLSNAQGKDDAIEKVKGMTKEIRKRDKALGKLIDALLKKYGLSQAALKDLSNTFWN